VDKLKVTLSEAERKRNTKITTRQMERHLKITGIYKQMKERKEERNEEK
jgi:hypothetical protein